MAGSTKRRAIIFLGLVMMITIVVAAGLPRLELQPGLPLPRLEQSRLVIPPGEANSPVAVPVSQFVKIFWLLVMAGLALFAVYRLARKLGWKKLAAYLQPVLAGFSILAAILYIVFMLLPGATELTQTELHLPAADVPAGPPLGSVPAPLFWLVAVGLLLVSCFVGIWVFRRPPARPMTIDLMAREAEKAWQALKTGLDLKDVIVQCYRQMSLALEREQGIEREEWMTTREFENFLEAAGIPHDPVRQLTQLFEAVRYGEWQPNPADEQKAIQCLEAIMSYRRVAGEPA